MAEPLPLDVIALTVWLLATSALLHLVMSLDKRRARRRRPRIAERTLLLMALIGGAWGGFVAMHVLRHKTRKWRFRVLLPMFSLLWAIVWLWVARS